MDRTDLHVHIEVLKDGVWHHYANPSMKRSDIVFKLFAGLETYRHKFPVEVNRIPTREGLPDDMSVITKLAYEYDKTHLTIIHHEGVATKADLVEMRRVLNMAKQFGKSEMQKFVFGKFGSDTDTTAIVNAFDPKVDLEEDIFHTYISGEAITRHENYDDVRVVFWFDN